MSNDLSPEARRAFDALLEAGAEASIAAMRERRWMFPAFGAVFGAGFVLIGVSAMAWYASLETTLFGLAFIAAGVFAACAMANGYRKVTDFLALYDEHMRGEAGPASVPSVYVNDNGAEPMPASGDLNHAYARQLG